MQFFPVSFAIVVLFVLAVRRGLERGIVLAIALIPFGMAAFANLPALGNLSLPAAEVVAGCTIGLLVLNGVVRTPLTFLHGVRQGLDRTGLLLVLLALYGTFSAIVLVRLFEADLYVFPLNASEEGLRVSRDFGSRVELLAVGSTNVSQLLYLLFSIAFFFLCRAVAQRRGTQFLHESLATAAWVNLALGALDAAGLDGPLAFVRTAKYALLDSHQVEGMARIIGGFAEASAYGSFSAVMTSYFAAHYLFGGTRRSAILAIGSAVAAVASFSSSAYLGLGVAAAGLVAGAAWAFLNRRVPVRHLVFLHSVALGALVLVFVVLITGLPEVVVGVLDQLLFSKAESSSGLERAAWAQVSMNAFADSHYLGVGIGSLRGNGLASVYLGSVGIPGTALLCLFYLRVLTAAAQGGTGPGQGSRRAIANAARLSAVTVLSTAAVSATTPDPGLMMMLFCAILTTPAPLAQTATQAAVAAPTPVSPRLVVPDVWAAADSFELGPAPFIDLGAPLAGGDSPHGIDVSAVFDLGSLEPAASSTTRAVSALRGMSIPDSDSSRGVTDDAPDGASHRREPALTSGN